MMDAKLTIKLNQEVIESAKKYALLKKQSLSRIIEAYLQSLTTKQQTDDIVISPFVESMSRGKGIPVNLDIKKTYGDYLLKKNK